MGGFAPLCPAPAAGNDELEIVVPHGSRLVSREVRGTRVWHQVLTCRPRRRLQGGAGPGLLHGAGGGEDDV